MNAPTFDHNSYPTDETLAAIRTWDVLETEALLNFVKTAWHIQTLTDHMLYAHERQMIHADENGDDKFLRLATGGWSGNEDLIEALRANQIVWGMTWRLSTCGGLHIFKYPSIDSRPSPENSP